MVIPVRLYLQWASETMLISESDAIEFIYDKLNFHAIFASDDKIEIEGTLLVSISEWLNDMTVAQSLSLSKSTIDHALDMVNAINDIRGNNES